MKVNSSNLDHQHTIDNDRTGAIMVFGGAGFIGTHLLRSLSAISNQRLICVDIKEPPCRLSNVEYIQGDVRELTNLNIEGDVSTIYNLAAVHTTPGHAVHEYYETNIAGASQTVAFARRKRVKTVIFTSSISVYGAGEETKSESSVPTPESAYGWSKWLAEGVYRDWVGEDTCRRLVICRPAVVFGSGEGGNFTRLASLLKKGFFVYPGRKDTIKACFYVEDLVDALIFASSRPEAYVLFNGCYPDRYTLEQIVTAFRERHFPRSRTLTVPRIVVSGLAAALRPFSTLGLGIHPDRVTKLVRSTDVLPNWLLGMGKAEGGRLESALDRWGADSYGSFE